MLQPFFSVLFRMRLYVRETAYWKVDSVQLHALEAWWTRPVGCTRAAIKSIGAPALSNYRQMDFVLCMTIVIEAYATNSAS